MSFLRSNRQGELVDYNKYSNKDKVSLPTIEELKTKTLEDLIKFRTEFEEKLDYMRKNNAPDNEILLENEKYYRIIERIVKDKIQQNNK